LATENQQAIINDVKIGVYMHKNLNKIVKNNKEHAEFE
jgi:hypothetical protein